MRRPIEWLFAFAIIFGIGYIFYLKIVFPTTEKSRESACVRNVYQLSLAMASYRADFDGSFPLGRIDDQCWIDALEPRISSDENYKPVFCPNRLEDQGFGYGMNYYIQGEHESRVLDDIVTLCDTGRVNASRWWVVDNRFRPKGLAMSQPLDCHPRGANIAFMDCHVETIDHRKLKNFNWITQR